MLIGIDASRANRRHKTGTEWYSYYLIKHLAEIDSENEYILYTDTPLSGGLIDLAEHDEQILAQANLVPEFFGKNHQIIKSPHNNFKAKVLRWPFSYLWTLGRLTQEMLFHRPNVLFVPAHTLPLIQPKKTITTIHDIAFIKQKQLYYKEMTWQERKIVRAIIRWLVRILTLGKYRVNAWDYLEWSTKFALQAAKKIITVSAFTKKEIIDIYNTKEDKLAVIHNGYNDRLYGRIQSQEKIAEVLDKYGIKGDYFLYVGRLEKKKNTPQLIESLAILKENHPEVNHKLVLIGNASYGYDEVKYSIDEFDLYSEVIMLGWVPEADMPYIYNGASAFIFPTRYEGFGIPVVQAMACGVPTAVSNIEVLREVAGNSVLYFDPNDKYSIAYAMHTLATDKRLKQNLRNKGFEQAKKFSWRKCAEETLKEINSL